MLLIDLLPLFEGAGMLMGIFYRKTFFSANRFQIMMAHRRWLNFDQNPYSTFDY